ncbi:MAG: hypothetical protein IKH06_07010 [Clostridiales bacterium]|nr:hypothetical protein [Clostridiales bacterium]
MMMAGLFLLLWGGVGFIQDKRFMSSAPKEALEVIPDRMPERFKGQYAVGYVIVVIAFALMGGAMVIGAWNGIRNDFSFWQFFIRFMVMLLALKAYDVIFFDWVLLCNAGFDFFPRFYPECKPVLGHYLFGYNWKTHLAHVIAFFPISAVIAWICTLF